MSNNKSRSTKPYDSSNSFVKKVASRVSGLIPRSTSWLSGWFSPTSAQGEGPIEREEQVPNEEDNFQDALEKPPPAKRFRLTSNQEYVDTYLGNQNVNQGESSSRLVPNNFDTSAIPGPSGVGARSSGFVASTPAVTSVEHHEPKANGDDCSESGESTSGCSSLEPQINRGLPTAQTQSRQNESLSPRKRLLDDKQNYSYLQNSRSLYLDRTSNSRSNQTIGRRNNPSFCVNTFGSPLFGERGTVNDMILNSPFYIGRTTYGGASSASYRRSIGSTSLSSSPANSEKLAKHTIKVKPGHSQPSEDSSMSQTAKRILATLEQFSTPILDAKRIPVSKEPALSSLGSRKRSRADDSGNSQLVLEQPRVPQRTPNKPLHWAKGGPRTTQLTIPVVPDTLILKRRELVQDSRADSIAMTSSSSSVNVDSYTLRTENENNISTRNTLKMKPRINNERETKEPEMGSEVNLPKISLPISSLPTFDISVPAPKPIMVKSPQSSNALSFGTNAMRTTSSVTKPLTSAFSSSLSHPKTQDASRDTSFSFSSPIKVSSVTKDQPLSSVNNFTFSKPLPASAKFSEPTRNCVSARPKASEPQSQNDSQPSGLKPASELKSGSVMDILGKGIHDTSKNASQSTNGGVSLMDKFKPAAGTWECDTCFIRNKSDLKKCAACTNPREVKNQTTASSETKTTLSASSGLKNDTGFGAQFKMSQGMWECSMCMVRNKDCDEKCVSCTSPKPGAAPVKPAAPATNFSGWGDKFKPASNTWECSVCMVRNGQELTACQSCTTKKPGSSAVAAAAAPIKNSWGDQFKKPEGSWSCSDCMVTNKAADLKCVACSCKKPGTESGPPSPKQNSKFSFGMPAASDKGSSTSSFSFGIPKDNKETKQADKPNVSSSTGFKFGESKPVIPASGFTFGVPSTSPPSGAEKAPNTTTPSTSALSATPVFTMTSTTSASKTTSLDVKPADVPVCTTPAESNKPTFSFGVPKSGASPMFSFGQPSASAPTSKPSSSTASPIGGKRKLGDDAPSSSAPMKFGIGIGSQANALSQTKPVFTSSSSVSSTSGPVFAFSSASHSSSASTLLSTSVTSTANGQNTGDGANLATTNSMFSSLVSSPTSSLTAAKPAPAFGLAVATSKDESVTSTWKLPTSSNTTGSVATKSNLESNGTPGNTKPAFTFGSNVSSSGMSFGARANTGSAAPTFAFGGASDKPAAMNKPAASFGSPASSTTLFGSTAGSLANATPSFGSPSSSGFGNLTSNANTSQPFQVTNSVPPSFSTPAASAFTSPFGTNSEEKKSGFPYSAPSEAKKPGFSFNAPSDENKLAFSFGSKPEDANKPAFSFTSTTTAQNSFQSSSSSSVFTFGSSAPATNGPAKPGFAFGSQPSPFSGFNSQQSSSPAGFNFGAPTPSFGSAHNNSAAPTPSPFEGASSTAMFASPTNNFGSPFSSSNPQPTSGFNFSASGAQTFGAQSQSTGVPAPFAFTETQKPTFNFSSGAPVNFAATPQDGSGAPPARRIKKAARRTVLR